MRLVGNPSYKHSKKILDEFNRLKSSIYYKDHSTYTDEKIKNMLDIVNSLKNFRIKSEQIRWITRFIYDLDLDIHVVKEDYLPVVIAHAKYKDKLKPLFEYNSQHDLFLEIQSLNDRDIFVKEKDYGIIYSNNEFFIAVPETVEASQMLGKGTSWCTAALEDNRYEGYILGNNDKKLILYYVIFINRKPSDPNFKICIGCINNLILHGHGITVDSKNTNLWEPLHEEPHLKKSLGKCSDFITEYIVNHSNKIEAHPMVLRAREIIMNDNLFKEEIQRRRLYPFDERIIFPNVGYEKYREQKEKLARFLMLFLTSGKASSKNIDFVADVSEKHALFSRDNVLEIIKHQGEVLSAENFLKIYGILYGEYSIFFSIAKYLKDNELNKIAIHVYNSSRSAGIEVFFSAVWAHRREAYKIIYKMADKDENYKLVLIFDSIMEKRKQIP